MENVDMPVELKLAAVIHLLSSSALRGATFHKTEALRGHLRSVADSEGISPHLRRTLRDVLDGWEAVHCHPASVAVDFPSLANASGHTH